LAKRNGGHLAKANLCSDHAEKARVGSHTLGINREPHEYPAKNGYRENARYRKYINPVGSYPIGEIKARGDKVL
jgi:hypothetical protein